MVVDYVYVSCKPRIGRIQVVAPIEHYAEFVDFLDHISYRPFLALANLPNFWGKFYNFCQKLGPNFYYPEQFSGEYSLASFIELPGDRIVAAHQEYLFPIIQVPWIDVLGFLRIRRRYAVQGSRNHKKTGH